MNVLLFGGSGMLGSDVKRVLNGNVHVFSPSHSELDLTDAEHVNQVVASFQPEVIINCTAYTDVEGAEEQPEAAWQLNAQAVANVARAARRCGSRLIHVSTDYVFDGLTQEPLTEDARCRPLSVYGQTKRAGELACLSLLPGQSVVVRTSWLYGGLRSNFVSTMLKLAVQRERLEVIDDQFGSPTYTLDLAVLLKHLLSRPLVTGILHASNKGNCSWYRFALTIMEKWGKLGHTVKAREVVPIKTSDWPTKAARPHYSVLDTGRLMQELNYSMPTWEDALDRYLVFRSESLDSC